MGSRIEVLPRRGTVGHARALGRTPLLVIAAIGAASALACTAASRSTPPPTTPPQGPATAPGRLIDVGCYRVHLLCTGPFQPGAPTIVLSIGAGGFASDWSLVQKPLSESARVCSYDRPGFGWSDAGPTPRTFVQEAFELRAALDRSGERARFLLVGQSLGAAVVRRFVEAHPADVAGAILVEPLNENAYLGYRGQWVIPRTLASARPVPPPRSFAESPPVPLTNSDSSACLSGGERKVRLFRCFAPHDDYFAEEMAAFHASWTATPHPLGAIPLVVIMGTKPRDPPPGLTEAQVRSDSLRLDLAKLSSRGRLVNDPLSGHHVQRDNPAIIVDVVRQMMLAGGKE